MPNGFVTDGCTGFFQVWRGISLTACCADHDLAWFLHPGDWWAWLVSNFGLGWCFVTIGAVELSVPAILATCTVGAALFSGLLKKWK